MNTVKQKIKNKTDEDKSLAQRVSVKCGEKDADNLYNFLQDPSREMRDFQFFLDVLKEIFPKEYNSLLIQYCKETSPNKNTIKGVIEYASVHENKEMIEAALEALSNSTNKNGKEFYSLYSLKESKERFGSKVLNKKLGELNIKNDDLLVLSDIMMMNEYIRQAKFGLALEKSELIEEMLPEIKDSYLRNSFTKRYLDAKMALVLNEGDHLETERLGKLALSVHDTSPLDIFIIMNMGNAYIMHSYDISMSYFEKALSISELLNDDRRAIQVKNSIDFLNCYWKKHESSDILPDEDYSDWNRSFYYISIGEIEIAKKCLEALDEGTMDDRDKSFYYFYKGLTTGDKYDHYKSVKYFMRANDKNYRKMPLIELERMGEDKFILETMAE